LKSLKVFLKEEIFAIMLLALFILLTVLMPGHIRYYASFIDYKTIITMLSLVTVATALKKSNYLDKTAAALAGWVSSELELAFFMCGLSFVLSMFLTNDITLFIIVPITVCLRRSLSGNTVTKLVIMEAIAVNAGSALTPIGNPQNIFLWNSWGITFLSFVQKMAMPVAVMAAALAAYILIFFKRAKFAERIVLKSEKTDVSLAGSSVILMLFFLLMLKLNAAVYAMPVIMAFYLVFYRRVLMEVDWMLIITFVLMFIDFRLIAAVPQVQNLINSFDMNRPGNVFLASAVLSQFMSNVPAAIFISKFSGDRLPIAYGVNLAGNGTIIASLANLIAMRLLKDKNNSAILRFHIYSIPYFLATAFIVWLFIK
jgi:Na+/H+ antiporter NhaD/arsenite permease-like protein